jgi:WD40 repeat protein
VGSRAPHRRLWPGYLGHLELGREGALFVDGARVWSTGTGARVHRLDGTLALSHDGRLALVSHGGTVSVVAVGSGDPVAGLRDAGRPVSAAFSPDGRRVLTSRKSALDLWDAATGRRVARLGRSGEAVNAYAFGAGGSLVLALLGGRAATFDATTGKPLTTVAGEFSALSPDGSVAVSLPLDGTMKVVDVKTGVATLLQTGSASAISAVRFGPDSSLIVAEEAKGSVVRVLRCPICASDDELLRRARATLAAVSGFQPSRPPISISATS